MKRKGFTLVELLAVIVILAILIAVATPNVIGLLNKQKESSTDIVVTNLKDAAVSYAKEQIALGKLHLSACKFEINAVNTATANLNKGGKCVTSYSVDVLKKNGTFEDKAGTCKTNGTVYIYKYNNNNYDEIKAYVPDNVCKVK